MTVRKSGVVIYIIILHIFRTKTRFAMQSYLLRPLNKLYILIKVCFLNSLYHYHRSCVPYMNNLCYIMIFCCSRQMCFLSIHVYAYFIFYLCLRFILFIPSAKTTQFLTEIELSKIIVFRKLHLETAELIYSPVPCFNFILYCTRMFMENVINFSNKLFFYKN